MKNTILAFTFLFCISGRAQSPSPLTPSQKVFGLSRFWQEVNYNFVYLDKIDRSKWDSAYVSLIDIVQKTPDDYTYYKELQRFCAMLKDGHTNVNFPNAIRPFNTMFGDYRLLIENIEGKAIITQINPSKKDEIPPGSEIISVNGLPTEVYRKKFVEPYISSSTEHILRDWSTSNLLQGREGESYKIVIKTPANIEKEFTLTHSRTTETDLFPPQKKRELLELVWLDNSIAHLSLNSFDDPKIDSLFENKLKELYKAKALIIDLRFNGGGNTYIGTNILKYLTRDRKLYGSQSSSRLHVASHKAWGKFLTPQDTLNGPWPKQSYLSYHDRFYYKFPNEPMAIKLPKGSKSIIVPTVILIGHQTASAAEDFLVYADGQKHMTKIGEPTFGSTGQPYLFDLPGGGSARVCTKKDTYPDGREFVGVGVKPDILITKSVNDYLTGRDAALLKAIDFLNEALKR